MQLWTTVPSAICVYLVVLIVESLSLVYYWSFFLLLTFEALLRDKEGDQISWYCFGYASISYDQKPHTWIISLVKLRYFCLEEICGKKFVIVNALRFLHIRSWKIICIVYELCNVPKWSTVPLLLVLNCFSTRRNLKTNKAKHEFWNKSSLSDIDGAAS